MIKQKTVSFLERSSSSSIPNHSVLGSKTSFGTGHEADVNDAKMDYYGSKLATASSDKSVRIFAVDSKTGGYHQLGVLTGFNGPVLHLSWSHPSFGSLLATASYDCRVIVWKESNDEHNKPRWSSVFDEKAHGASVNAVAWSAPEFGAMLAAASSDGSLSVHSMDNQENWTSKVIPKAHELGCQTVSWSPKALRFASGGNDYNVKIWSLSDSQEWTLENTLQAHTDWVFQVEWSPIAEVLVSSGRDGRILLWMKNEEPEVPLWNHSLNLDSSSSHHININVSSSESEWSLHVLQILERGTMPHISWDPMGTFLCVSGDADEVSIWKQEGKDNWKLVGKPRIKSGKISESFGV